MLNAGHPVCRSPIPFNQIVVDKTYWQRYLSIVGASLFKIHMSLHLSSKFWKFWHSDVKYVVKISLSERKTIFFRILLFIDLNIIAYDVTEHTQSLVKPYAHFMFIGSTWMHTLNWLLAPVVKLLNNFWTGTNILVWQ
jgi:hypothetical protein